MSDGTFSLKLTCRYHAVKLPIMQATKYQPDAQARINLSATLTQKLTLIDALAGFEEKHTHV
jgi:hypothetical protein